MAGLSAGINTKGGSRRLNLGAGLLAIDSLYVGASPGNAGTLLTLGSDYWLRPDNSLYYTRPYTYVEFRYPQYSDPQSIVITGVWGYSSVLLDASMNSGSNQLTSSVGFDQWDVGKYIRVVGAGTNGGALETSIASVSGNVATLNASALTTVTNAVGFWASAPSGVVQAVLAYAAFTLAPQIELYINRGLLRWKEGDVEKDYSRGKGTSALEGFQDRMIAQFRAGLSLYKRPWIA